MSRIIEFVSENNIQLTEATLYIALKRLLKDGKISSYSGKNKKGMSRRYYQITPEGKKSLRTFRKDWIWIENTLSALVGGNFDYYRES
jgi:PadR family transcriptional regulator PadR